MYDEPLELLALHSDERCHSQIADILDDRSYLQARLGGGRLPLCANISLKGDVLDHPLAVKDAERERNPRLVSFLSHLYGMSEQDYMSSFGLCCGTALLTTRCDACGYVYPLTQLLSEVFRDGLPSALIPSDPIRSLR